MKSLIVCQSKLDEVFANSNTPDQSAYSPKNNRHSLFVILFE